MKYSRFEVLPVWQEAVELSRTVYTLARHAAFQRHPGLRDQLERAALSVSNNIAEGFERGTTAQLLDGKRDRSARVHHCLTLARHRR